MDWLTGAALGLLIFTLFALWSSRMGDIDWRKFAAYGFCFTFWGGVLGAIV